MSAPTIHRSSSDFVTPASERTCCKPFARGGARPSGSLYGPAGSWFATRPRPPAITTRKTKGRATTAGEARPFGMRLLAARPGIRKTLSTASFEKSANRSTGQVIPQPVTSPRALRLGLCAARWITSFEAKLGLRSLSACSEPTTGSFAGSTRPTCARSAVPVNARWTLFSQCPL
jgi:hypothetical protein